MSTHPIHYSPCHHSPSASKQHFFVFARSEYVKLVRKHERDFCGKMTTIDIYKESTKRPVRPVIPIPSTTKQQAQIPAIKRRKRKRRRRKKARDNSVGPEDHDSTADAGRKPPAPAEEGPTVVVVNKGTHHQAKPQVAASKSSVPAKQVKDYNTKTRKPDKPVNEITVAKPTADTKAADPEKPYLAAVDGNTPTSAAPSTKAAASPQEQPPPSSLTSDKGPRPPAAQHEREVRDTTAITSTKALAKPEVEEAEPDTSENQKVAKPQETSHPPIPGKDSSHARKNSGNSQQDQRAADLSQTKLQRANHTTQPSNEQHFTPPSNPWSNPNTAAWSNANHHRAPPQQPVSFAVEPQRMALGIPMTTANARSVAPHGFFGEGHGPFGQVPGPAPLPQPRPSNARQQPIPIGAHRPQRARQQRTIGPIGKQTNSATSSHGASGARPPPPSSFNIFGTGSLFSGGTWGPQPMDSAALNRDSDGGNRVAVTGAAKPPHSDWGAPIPSLTTPAASAWSTTAPVPSNPWGRNTFGKFRSFFVWSV